MYIMKQIALKGGQRLGEHTAHNNWLSYLIACQQRKEVKESKNEKESKQ
jgi:hypothetical protein